jgi:hypothetical protein
MKRIAFAIALAAPATVHADPDDPGPYQVEVNEYAFGDAAFQPSTLPGVAEIRGVIHSPTSFADGPFPLVIVLHGRHATCYDPDGGGGLFDNVSQEWPCFGDHEPIPSYRGYDYWAAQLASHGYVVVSIGANGINANDGDADDGGASARAELVAAHLELWQAFVDTDEYGTEFNGAVDLQNVGLLGHSRGGEGVATFAAQNAANGSPFGVDAVLLLAPTDFSRVVVTDVPLAVVLPYCDGDVVNLQGVHYFDDSRYAAAGDAAPKYVFAMGRSNHNFYNTVWSPGTFALGGAFDDFEIVEFTFQSYDSHCSIGAGGPRLTEPEQQASFVAYANAFFRTHLGAETEWIDLLRGDADPPPSAAPAYVRTSYMPPDGAQSRLVVNRIATDDSLATNDLGGAVQAEGLATYDVCGVGPGGGLENFEHCVADPGTVDGEPYEGREPHVPGLAHLGLAFTGASSWVNELPAGTDASGFLWLQFRAGVDFEDDAAGDDPVDFTIALTDRAGVRAATTLQAWSDGLALPPGELYPIVPKLMLHGFRVPLAAFVDPEEGGNAALDLADLASVELAFDAGTGAILFSDLAFVDPVPPPPSGTDTGASSDSGEPPDTGNEPDGGSASDDGSTSGAVADDTSDGSQDGTTSAMQGDGGGDDGCGCRTTGAPWWGLVASLFVTRRRRRATALSFRPPATPASPS